MPAYAYAIEIKREPQPIKETRIIAIEQPLTLGYLREFIGENDVFSIQEAESFMKPDELAVTSTRLETEEERAKRVAKEEAYMTEYLRRNNK